MRLVRVVVFLVLVAVQALATYGQEVVATWTDTSGNWSNPTNWSTLAVPNNGGGTTYSVGIGSLGLVTMDMPSDTIDNLSLVSSLNINVGDRLSLASGTSSIQAALTNAGTLANFGTLNSLYSGEITNITGGHLINYGTLTSLGVMRNDGCLNNFGQFNVIDDNLANYGTLNNAGTIFLLAPYPYLYNYGILTNSGTISSSATVNNSGTINNGQYGQFLNSGNIINSGTIANAGIFSNSGAVLITNSGVVTTSTNYTQTAGSTAVDGTLAATNGAIVDIQGGTLGGTGSINGNVLMAGTMMPGDAPGTLTIIGNYEQKSTATSTGIFYEQMSPYSQAFLDVSGNVTLDPGAMLQISLLDGFNPLGLTFSIMDFSTLSGQFVNGSSFWDDNYLWDITYRQHEIDVTAVQAPEPSSLLLLGLGSILIGTYVRRRKVAQ